MSTRSGSTEVGATELLMFVSGYVYRLLKHEARRQGLRWTALMVLKDLDVLGPSSQRALAQIEQVRAPTMTVLLQQMETRGWVRRSDHRSDARVSLVSITRRGQAELRAAGRVLQKRLDQELHHVPDKLLRELKDSLQPLAAALMQNVAVSRESD
jgi:DNA-binding MarR family transcriptional regulator